MADVRQTGSLWSPQEDAILLRHVAKYGTKHWSLLQATRCLPHRDQKACCNRFILLRRKFFRARDARHRLNLSLQDQPSVDPKPEPQPDAETSWSEDHSEVHLPPQERPELTPPSRTPFESTSEPPPQAMQPSPLPSSLPASSSKPSRLYVPSPAKLQRTTRTKRFSKPSMVTKMSPSTLHFLLDVPQQSHFPDFEAALLQLPLSPSSANFERPGEERAVPLQTRDDVSSSYAPVSEVTWAPGYDEASVTGTWPVVYPRLPALSSPPQEEAHAADARAFTDESLQRALADLDQLSSELLRECTTQNFGRDSGLIFSAAPDALLDSLAARPGSLLLNDGLGSIEYCSQHQVPFNKWDMASVARLFN